MIAREVKLRVNKVTAQKLDDLLWKTADVFNWAIQNIERRKNAKLSYTHFSMCKLFSGELLRKWQVPNAVALGAVKQAHDSWVRCYKGLSKAPKLKGWKNKVESIAFVGDCKVDTASGAIHFPRIGRIRYKKYPLPASEIASTIRIVRKASGWHAVLLFKEDHRLSTNLIATKIPVGIDTGFKHLLTLSTGEKIDNPREFEKSVEQLARIQRGGGKKKSARLHERIANQRKDRNHKISHSLISRFNEIYITNDNLKGMACRFGKSVSSTAIGQLRTFLQYKAEATPGKSVKLVESKNTTVTCSTCKALTGPTGLSGLNVRTWECGQCGSQHDRDVNAAINILKSGQEYCLDMLEKADRRKGNKAA